MLRTIKKVFVTASAFLLAGALVLAQNPQTVRGTVNDPSGEPVIGASVMVKDTMNGAITDVGGAYVLPRVNPGSTLVFSCIGYTTQEITWTGGVLNAETRLEATAADVAAQGGGHLYYYLDPVKAGKGWLDKYYLEPIPSEELLLNEALKQQEGWK